MREELQDRSKFTKLVSGARTIEDILREELGDGFAAYRQRWRQACDQELVTEFPLHIGFELNHSCNMACPMCPWSVQAMKTMGRRSWFSFETFKRIIDEGVPLGLRSIALNWVNEPLIRDDLPAFVAYARRAGVLDTFIHSNGMLLDERMAAGLIDAGATRLMISLDAYSHETYDKIRIGGDLDRVRDNVFAFLRLRKEKGARLPLLSVNFVRMSINEHELEDFLAFWEPHVDFFAIQELINPFPDRDDKRYLERDGKEPRAAFNCAQPFQRLTITYDGEVLPCCTSFAPKLSLGNIADGGLKELWDSPAMRALRDLHRRGRYYDNPVCAACVKGLMSDKEFVAA